MVVEKTGYAGLGPRAEGVRAGVVQGPGGVSRIRVVAVRTVQIHGILDLF